MLEANKEQAPQQQHGKGLYRHISDIDVWVTPDRNYLIFIVLSFVGGLFALDHIYLRSYDTAFYKILLNFFGLGIWYFWDLIQIATESKKIRTTGLASPFDWIFGIGRGVFTDPFAKMSGPTPYKSYIIWTVLALMLGMFGADKFYIGDNWHGFTKLVCNFSPLILFGLFWNLWDAYHAFFMTKDTLMNGIALPPPLEALGFSKTPGDIFLPGGTKPDGGKSGGFADAFAGFTSNTFNLLAAPPMLGAMGGIQERLDKLREAERGYEESHALKNFPSAPSTTSQPAEIEMTEIRAPAGAPPQGGGGYVPENGPGAVVAGALGAVVLAGGLKGLYDFLSRL